MTPRSWGVMVSVAVLLVAGIVAVPSPANAQDAPTAQFQTTAGGYYIEVEEFAASLSVGTVQFLITLRDEDSGQGIDDAQVRVRVKHVRSGEETSATAVNSPNTPERYRARVSLKASGAWRVWVEADGRMGRVAVEIASLDVPDLRRYSAGTFVFMVVFMVLILGAVYVWWSSQIALKERKSDSRSGEANS